MCTFNPVDKRPNHGCGTKPTEKPSVVNSGEKGDGRDKGNGKKPHHHRGC